MEKPFSQACENNREPILRFLAGAFRNRRKVLEIGSGTGQHAVHFAAAMPWLEWQPSDRPEHHAGIRAWLQDEPSPNLRQPLALDVNGTWPSDRYDAVFTANTFHIMGWEEVQRCIAGMAEVTTDDATLAVYGPFRIAGDFTSPSNAAFHASLQERDPRMGIRDIEAVEREMHRYQFRLLADFAMPANNRLVLFRKQVEESGT